MDKVSIIVPCYNLEKVIKKCINSIIKQSYKELEIIIINDGSTDKSKIICEKLMKEDSRITLINKRNAGIEVARMDGIKFSTGDYIMFVDGDDYIPKYAVEELLNCLKRNNSDVSYGNISRVIGKFSFIKKKTKYDVYNCGLIKQPELFNKYFISYFGVNLLPVNMVGCIYRSDLIKEHLPPLRNVNHAEDLLFNMHLFPYIKSISTIPDNVYFYRYGGMTTKMNYKLFSTACKVYDYKINMLNQFDYENGYIYSAIELKNFLNTFIKSLFVHTKLNRKDIEELCLTEIDNQSFRNALVRIKKSKYNDKGIEYLCMHNISKYIDFVFPNTNLLSFKYKIKKYVLKIINIFF